MRSVWNSEKWKSYDCFIDSHLRKGLIIRIQKDVNDEVKLACLDFAKWLRKKYEFPIRVPIYIRSSAKIRTNSGDYCSAKIFEPYEYCIEPYISIAVGNIEERIRDSGRNNALAGILGSMAHELTHYFQWINRNKLTDKQAERQANYYRARILSEYASIRERP